MANHCGLIERVKLGMLDWKRLIPDWSLMKYRVKYVLNQHFMYYYTKICTMKKYALLWTYWIAFSSFSFNSILFAFSSDTFKISKGTNIAHRLPKYQRGQEWAALLLNPNIAFYQISRFWSHPTPDRRRADGQWWSKEPGCIQDVDDCLRWCDKAGLK